LLKLLDIEKEFDSLVRKIDGQRVDEIIGISPNHPNADYLFDDDNIIIELKCLQDNKLNDKNISKKISLLYKKWNSQGHTVKLSQDGWRATVSNLSQEQSKEILKIYAKPIRKQIIKGNKQIKITKEKLDKPNHKGVLVLANDGNLAIDPQHIYAILGHILGDSYSSINAVIFFTANYLGRANFTNVDTLAWVNLNRPNREPVCDSFFEKLQFGWVKHMERIIGSTIPLFRLENEKSLSSIVNTNKDITKI